MQTLEKNELGTGQRPGRLQAAGPHRDTSQWPQQSLGSPQLCLKFSLHESENSNSNWNMSCYCVGEVINIPWLQCLSSLELFCSFFFETGSC